MRVLAVLELRMPLRDGPAHPANEDMVSKTALQLPPGIRIDFRSVQRAEGADVPGDIERPDLPSELHGYARAPGGRSLFVMAVRESDGIVVGMGGGWVLLHASEPPALLVKSADVDSPYGAELARVLVTAIMQFAKNENMGRVVLDDYVQARIVGH
jgi:hypothetical protein